MARIEERDGPDASDATGGWRASEAAVYAQLSAGMVLFGSATPLSKIVTGDMPVFVASLLRVLIGAAVLAPLVYGHRREVSRLARRDWLLVGGIAVFGMFGFSAFMRIGMRIVPGVTGAIVMATTPAVTAIAAVFFLSERVTWRKVVAIALAVAGVAILQIGGGSAAEGTDGAEPTGPIVGIVGTSAAVGMLFVFLAVCCEAAYTLFGRQVSRGVDPTLVAFLGAVLSIPLFVPLAAWQWPSFAPGEVGWSGWAALAVYGGGTLAIGTWAWYAGVAKTEGSVAAGFMGLMPVSALILSYILLGEAFRWIHLAGFVVVLAGVLLIAREHARTA